MIRVLLVEDHAAFRQALALTIATDPDIVVTSQAGSVSEARRCLENVDVAVLDLDLPDGNGSDLIHWLHEVNPAALALVLTASARPRELARAVEAGAAGVLHKTAAVQEIIDAIRRLADGELLFTPTELATLMRLARQQHLEERSARQIIASLTPREHDVLRALGEGLSDKEIAARLHVSKDTVHTHMVNVLGKLGVESRLQAVIFAIRHGLVTLG